MLEKKEIKNYLEMIHELKQDYQFYDLHTHPFEFFFSDLAYLRVSESKDIFCRAGHFFSPPEIRDIDLKNHSAQPLRSMKNLRSDFFRLPLEKQHQCTGSGVFQDLSELSGVEKIALLPVASSERSLQQQMNLMKKYFSDEENFIFGGGVPNDVTNEEIASYLKKLMQNYHVKIIKIHPNACAIDLRNSEGVSRMEAILESCHQFRLPLIVHTGGNLILKEKGLDILARIENLQKVNWSLTQSAVIFAHAAAYDLDEEEVKENVFPKLKTLLHRFGNLLLDLSGLDSEIISSAIDSFGLERIIFGSDALYHDQWKAVAIFLHCIEKLGLSPEKSFIQVANKNPNNCLIRGRE